MRLMSDANILPTVAPYDAITPTAAPRSLRLALSGLVARCSASCSAFRVVVHVRLVRRRRQREDPAMHRPEILIHGDDPRRKMMCSQRRRSVPDSRLD